MNTNKINKNVIELLELVSLDSPFKGTLMSNYKHRLVKRLLTQGMIDRTTADYLLAQ